MPSSARIFNLSQKENFKMAVPSQIVQAAGSYRFNAQLLDKSIDGLTAEEWQKRPGESSNAMIWVAGHIVWARSRVLGLLGKEWSKPWLASFERGSKPGDAAKDPSPEELVAAWQEVKAALSAALEEASEQALDAPGPEKIPSFDGKLSGTVAFMAWHEGYHVGQAAYLHRWLGHGQVAG
jgi:uncharacterized damage-inducible protein DinB